MKRLQIKAENVTDQGIFTGHASVFGVVDGEDALIRYVLCLDLQPLHSQPSITS